MKPKQTFPAAIKFATDTEAAKPQAFNMTISAPPCAPFFACDDLQLFAPALDKWVM
jgi:hypothetical protein